MKKENEFSGLLAAARGDKAGDLLLQGARIVEVFSGQIIKTNVLIYRDRIAGVGDDYKKAKKIMHLGGKFILPGLIDSHIHIESSLLGLPEFARLAVRSGTTAVVADPHEIANVLGRKGIEYMIRASRDLPLDVFFTIPSCVPATEMESSGARIGPREISQLLKRERVVGLAEMMNFPGVVAGDPVVLAKIKAAREQGKPVDGHAPGLTGPGLSAYVAAGIRSDHECTSRREAEEKLRAGMTIMIREGSAARNLKDLIGLVNPANSHRCLLVSDDRDPEDMLEEGQVNSILRRAVKLGLDPVLAVRMATINPAAYFGLAERGAIAPGYLADLVLVSDLKNFNAERVFKGGVPVAEKGRLKVRIAGYRDPSVRGTVQPGKISPRSFRIPAQSGIARVIGIVPDQIITRSLLLKPRIIDGEVVSDPRRDIIKLAVIERHSRGKRIGLGLVQGFGLKSGALASTVAHDSHNIVAVGVEDQDMFQAALALKKNGGGYAVVDGGKVKASLPLPVAGLLSEAPAEDVIRGLKSLNKAASALGCRFSRPFSTLSFLALPVIPELKLTDKGLVDVIQFKLVSLFK